MCKQQCLLKAKLCIHLSFDEILCLWSLGNNLEILNLISVLNVSIKH